MVVQIHFALPFFWLLTRFKVIFAIAYNLLVTPIDFCGNKGSSENIKYKTNPNEYSTVYRPGFPV